MAAKEGNAKSGAVLAELFKGRYITNGQDDPSLKEMAEVCDLIGAISKDDGTSGDKYTKGGAADVDGTKAFSITATDSDGENSTLYVATQGKPYLVRMEQTAGAEPGQLTFSDFDKPLDLKAPVGRQRDRLLGGQAEAQDRLSGSRENRRLNPLPPLGSSAYRGGTLKGGDPG